MTFEEEFPSLRHRGLNYKLITKPNYDGIYYTEAVIRSFCLDKQIVKDMIWAMEEEFWHIVNEIEDPKAYEKAVKIRKALLEELERITK